MSDPTDRDSKTINLNPMLASQAPKVNKIIARCGINILLMCVIEITINIDVNIMASKQNSESRRWVYCRLRVMIVIVKANINRIKMFERDIELRVFQSLIYKINALKFKLLIQIKVVQLTRKDL